MPTIFLTRKENHTQIFLQALGLSLIPASCFGFRGPDVERTTNSPLRKLAEGALEMLTPSLVMTWLSRECVDVAILGRGRPPRLGRKALAQLKRLFCGRHEIVWHCCSVPDCNVGGPATGGLPSPATGGKRTSTHDCGRSGTGAGARNAVRRWQARTAAAGCDSFEVKNSVQSVDATPTSTVGIDLASIFRARSWRRLGAILFIIGRVILFGSPVLAAGITWLLHANIPLAPGVHPTEAFAKVTGILTFWVMAIGMLVASSALPCIRRAKRLAVLSAKQISARDQRAPVLYLRSFQDEGLWQTFSLGWEEQFARALQDAGPVLAIGRPGEKLPLLGAARWQVENEKWQAEVQSLLPQAGLVVLRVGESAGLWWEIEQALLLVRPERLLFLVPASEPAYEAFRARLEGLLGRALPHTGIGRPLVTPQRAYKWDRLGPTWLLYFAADWTPHLSGTQKVPFGGRAWHGKLATFEYEFRTALRPLFAQLGVVWKQPRQPWMRFFVVGAPFILFSIFVGLIAFQHDRPLSFKRQESPYERLAREFGTRVLQRPEVADRLRGVNDPEVERVVAELIKDGLPRLPDERLKRRAELKQRLLELADISSCAALMRGTGGMIPSVVLETLGKLDERALEEWFALQEQALVAGVQRPRVQAVPTDREIRRSIAEIFSRLPSDAAQRLQRAMSNIDNVSQAEACWAGRTLIAGVNQLLEPSRSIAARALALE